MTRDLRMALVEGVDRAIFLGDDGATPNADADIVGLTTAAGLTEKTLTQANKVKGSNVLQDVRRADRRQGGDDAGGPADRARGRREHHLVAYAREHRRQSVDTTIAEFLRRFGLNWLDAAAISRPLPPPAISPPSSD